MILLLLNFFLDKANSPSPTRLPTGQWNCSIPNWTQYRKHFACNLDPECVAGEDEADCPYSGCGAGNISVSGSCFFFVQFPDGYYTWEGQSRVCQRYGGHLATLAKDQEWNTVIGALRNRKEQTHIVVGLSTASSDLPTM